MGMIKEIALLQQYSAYRSRYGIGHLLRVTGYFQENLWVSSRYLSHAQRCRRLTPLTNCSNQLGCKCTHSQFLHNYSVLHDVRFSQIQNLHTSSRQLEDAKSIADKTVQILSGSKKKDAPKKTLSNIDSVGKEVGVPLSKSDETRDVAEDLSKKASKSKKGEETSTKSSEEAQLAVDKPKPLYVRAWRRTVKEVKHYYHGFRLLFIDVKICTRYVWGVLNGKTLTRRERKQLVRTSADLFRLVPFMAFVIIPFFEFLLPVALKLFPGLLPSTFKEADKEKEKLKKRLKAKLEMAKFLQDTVEESALVKSGAGQHTELAREFQQFLKEIREGGTTVKTEDILRFTQLFKDEITLDNMTREHLIALCKLLEIKYIGTTKMIAFQLSVRLRHLKADDKIINKEGLGALSDTELQQACRARGMRAIGVPQWRLRYQLKQWLDLHLNENIPISLLLMSRALYLPDTLSAEEKLKTVIGALPENTTTEAEIHAAEVTGEKIDPAAKIKLITAEEEAIARERKEKADEQQELEKESSKQSELLSAAEDLEKHTIVDKAEPIAEMSKADVVLNKTAADTQAAAEVLEDVAPVIPSETDLSAADQEISSQDIEQMEDVFEQIAEEKKLDIEQSELDTLKGDVDEYQEDLTQLKTLVERDAQIIESKGAKRLSSHVNRMINSLSDFSEDLHRQKQQILEEIEVNEVKMKRNEDFKKDNSAASDLRRSIQERQGDVISINELVLAMRRLQKIPNETKVQKIAEVLDDDKDGQINISLALKVLHDVGVENVNIKVSQMTDILDLLKKEADVEKAKKDEAIKSAEFKDNTPEGSDTSAQV